MIWYNPPMAREEFRGKEPRLLNPAFVAASADLIGNVSIAEDASIWHHATLRGDLASISVGKGSNVQDNSCIHVEDGKPCTIGEYVTVGHSVTLHACTVEDRCLVGMGAVVLDGAVIGRGSLVGAHALVTKNTVIPPYSLALGSPAKVVKRLGPEVEEAHLRHALEYIALAREYAGRAAGQG